jgi:hypothetical protein
MGSVPCWDPPGPRHAHSVGDSLARFCALHYLLGWEEPERWWWRDWGNCHLHVLQGVCQDLMVGWVVGQRAGWVPNHSHEFRMPCAPLMGYPLEALS